MQMQQQSEEAADDMLIVWGVQQSHITQPNLPALLRSSIHLGGPGKIHMWHLHMLMPDQQWI